MFRTVKQRETQTTALSLPPIQRVLRTPLAALAPLHQGVPVPTVVEAAINRIADT